MRLGTQVRRRQGYYAIKEVAEMLHVPLSRFRNWLWAGYVPRPRTRFAGSKRLYYVKTDVEGIKKLVGK
jgi:hypothetical protein